MISRRRNACTWAALLACVTLSLYLLGFDHLSLAWPGRQIPTKANWRDPEADSYFWKALPTLYPPASIRPLPTSGPVSFPPIQATGLKESAEARSLREKHRRAVKSIFTRCWASYREHAWLADELTPNSGASRNTFGGWAATLVDSLDTLWIMEMREEFEEAVAAAITIDFTKTDSNEVNVFETTIRYLGGFLGAFDVSQDYRLLRKAVEIGEMLYKAFDTPNRMPITRWDIHAAMRNDRSKQIAGSGTLIAEIGSLSMEFTRLSILTGDPKWFDAVQAITDLMAAQQMSTELPGLWPLVADAQKQIFNGGTAFTLGAMADSVYEYLPKMSALLGGQLDVYQTMYERAAATAMKHNLFRPMLPDNDDILIAGQAHTKNGGRDIELEAQGQHLVCFFGGLMVVGGKMFNRQQDVDAATKLVEGCIWAYKSMPHGIMPETFNAHPCPSQHSCAWDESLWKREVARKAGEKDVESLTEAQLNQIVKDKHVPKGFTAIPDARYILRPEAIESVFVLYRATGREDLLESAWDMFSAIERVTSTEFASSAVWDVSKPGEVPQQSDSMESFWLGETLKYFYLIFSDPSLISLDEFVFNTEAHPLRRLVP
ncbi:family 47 glycoside hydrolase [Microdochium trichocladiopsis]|uniref:alpha-1,2-Mannosidase n=1 Tax=Microdochium trichocladiopsis TaxID=1682393 RepID=A0A9P8YFY8_9PEZI|nr:family 47 glycoside hydrolase [Microdochium trichocladiopsis]KAH7038271.1 family 47 glycoside hydrolase [Microdochium trichocladiopsis]